MNRWTVLLLVADLAGVAVAVVRAVWKARDGGDGGRLAIRLAEAAVAGTLIALLALRASDMPILVVLLLVGAAVLAGASVRPFVRTPPGPPALGPAP